MRSAPWLPWILSSANLVQSRKNARFHPNLMAHSLKNQAYFSPSHTLIRKISRRGAEFSHPIDAKPCWSPCPWTRSPSHAWPAKIRFALSLGYNVCVSWQKILGNMLHQAVLAGNATLSVGECHRVRLRGEVHGRAHRRAHGHSSWGLGAHTEPPGASCSLYFSASDTPSSSIWHGDGQQGRP